MSTTRPAFICASCARAIRSSSKPSNTSRAISNLVPQGDRSQTTPRYGDRAHTPRWQQTPPAMKMPFRVRKESEQPEWKVNHDPAVLDAALDKFVGDAAGRGVNGRDILPEEVKWLVVTHKSFEQGARGFNDRLAFLGRRIVDVQATRLLLSRPTETLSNPEESLDGQARIGPHQRHPALEGVENVTEFAKDTLVSPAKLARLARHYRLDKAVRWQPKQVEHLGQSGSDGIMASAVYAVIGAIALQKGGQVATDVARERVLGKLL